MAIHSCIQRLLHFSPHTTEITANFKNHCQYPSHLTTHSLRMNIQILREHRPGLYCVELRTAQWAEMVRWYRETLGLKVLVRVVDDGYALLEAGDTRIALIERASPGPLSARWSLGFEVADL